MEAYRTNRATTMTNQERLTHYEKEKQEWIVKAYEFLNKCDHVNYVCALDVAKRYDLLAQRVKKIL